MKKFTGDEWKFFSEYETIEAFDKSGKHICDIASIVNVDMPFLNPVNRDWKADARLIAVAPEMYMTLERCLGYIGALSKKTEFGFLDKLEKDISELLARIDGTEDEE